MKTCFLIASAQANLEALIEVLKNNNIKTFDSNFIRFGSDFTENLYQSLQKSDFALVVLEEGKTSPNIYYELGFAVALSKKILLIISPQVSLPTELLGVTYFRTELSNIKTLEYALMQFLKSPQSRRRVFKKIPRKSRPLGPKSEKFLNLLRQKRKQLKGPDIEKLVISVFKESGIEVFAERPVWNVDKASYIFSPDVAIWIDELDDLLGNPIIVEIATHRKGNEIEINVENHLKDIFTNTRTRTAILIFEDSPDINLTPKFYASGLVIKFQLEALLKTMKKKSFADILKDERNKIIHNIF